MWVSIVMSHIDFTSSTSSQGVSFFPREGNQIGIGYNSYFFRYFICSFRLFFFLGKSTSSLRFGVMVPVFDTSGHTGPFVSIPCSLLCLVLTGLCCNNSLLDLFSPRSFEFLQGENQVFIHFVSLKLITGLDA